MRSIVLIFVVVSSLVGCSQASDSPAVQRFFNEHKVGESADFGVFADKRELVAAVFGFGDDLSVCEKFAATLNQSEPGRFSCAPLNH